MGDQSIDTNLTSDDHQIKLSKLTESIQSEITGNFLIWNSQPGTDNIQSRRPLSSKQITRFPPIIIPTLCNHLLTLHTINSIIDLYQEENQKPPDSILQQSQSLHSFIYQPWKNCITKFLQARCDYLKCRSNDLPPDKSLRVFVVPFKDPGQVRNTLIQIKNLALAQAKSRFHRILHPAIATFPNSHPSDHIDQLNSSVASDHSYALPNSTTVPSASSPASTPSSTCPDRNATADHRQLAVFPKLDQASISSPKYSDPKLPPSDLHPPSTHFLDDLSSIAGSIINPANQNEHASISPTNSILQSSRYRHRSSPPFINTTIQRIPVGISKLKSSSQFRRLSSPGSTSQHQCNQSSRLPQQEKSPQSSESINPVFFHDPSGPHPPFRPTNSTVCLESGLNTASSGRTPILLTTQDKLANHTSSISSYTQGDKMKSNTMTIDKRKRALSCISSLPISSCNFKDLNPKSLLEQVSIVKNLKDQRALGSHEISNPVQGVNPAPLDRQSSSKKAGSNRLSQSIDRQIPQIATLSSSPADLHTITLIEHQNIAKSTLQPLDSLTAPDKNYERSETSNLNVKNGLPKIEESGRHSKKNLLSPMNPDSEDSINVEVNKLDFDEFPQVVSADKLQEMVKSDQNMILLDQEQQKREGKTLNEGHSHASSLLSVPSNQHQGHHSSQPCRSRSSSSSTTTTFENLRRKRIKLHASLPNHGETSDQEFFRPIDNNDHQTSLAHKDTTTPLPEKFVAMKDPHDSNTQPFGFNSNSKVESQLLSDIEYNNLAIPSKPGHKDESQKTSIPNSHQSITNFAQVDFKITTTSNLFSTCKLLPGALTENNSSPCTFNPKSHLCHNFVTFKLGNSQSSSNLDSANDHDWITLSFQ